MHRAFEAVCVTLQLSMTSDDKVTELVGEKIIELAVTGERNVDRLTARVLAEFGIQNDGSAALEIARSAVRSTRESWGQPVYTLLPPRRPGTALHPSSDHPIRRPSLRSGIVGAGRGRHA